MCCAEGAGVDVVVAKGALEADVEDAVVRDVCVLWGSEGQRGFLEGAVKGGQELGRLVQYAALSVACFRVEGGLLPIAELAGVCAEVVEGDDEAACLAVEHRPDCVRVRALKRVSIIGDGCTYSVIEELLELTRAVALKLVVQHRALARHRLQTLTNRNVNNEEIEDV
jgi:hypothetical protein